MHDNFYLQTKIFAGSGGLQYIVALFAGHNTQVATQCTETLYKQFVMELSELRESFWRQRKRDATTIKPTKRN